MKLPSVNCPNCNSAQRFKPHERKLADGSVEQFIVCQMCRQEYVIDNSRPVRRHTQRMVRVPEIR